MAIVNGYVDLNTLKARLNVNDALDDVTLEAIITAVSRAIDDWTGRRFYVVEETRYYTTRNPCEVWIDDLVSLTSLATDEDGDRTYETTWAATDYDLLPFNAAADGKPYSHIGVTPNGNYRFPCLPRAVKVTGQFGYSSTTPPVVREACILQVQRLLRRRDAPFGVAGTTEFGQSLIIARIDPDVRMMLAPYTLVTIA